jgi:hypothetical protein
VKRTVKPPAKGEPNLWNRALVASILVLFLALTARTLTRYCYLEFLQAVTANPVVTTLSVELVIGLALVFLWIHRDARSAGISSWPYIAVGASLGVAGPLLYLLRRPSTAAEATPGSLRRIPLLFLAFAAAACVLAIELAGLPRFLSYVTANESTELLVVDLGITATLIAVWTVRAYLFGPDPVIVSGR